MKQIQDKAEKYLVGQFKMCYTSGKGKRFVSVLVLNNIISGIRILIKERASYGLSDRNKFLFGTRTIRGRKPAHCSGWNALSELCGKAGLTILITATKTRQRLSTIYASLDMSPGDRKVFLDHMGHEEAISQENYQCPPVRVIGKLLQDVDQGYMFFSSSEPKLLGSL